MPAPQTSGREAVRRVRRLTVDKVAKHVQVGTQHLKPEELHLGVSPTVPRILSKLDAPMIVVRRRRNF